MNAWAWLNNAWDCVTWARKKHVIDMWEEIEALDELNRMFDLVAYAPKIDIGPKPLRSARADLDAFRECWDGLD
jgi:hypothetical protein